MELLALASRRFAPEIVDLSVRFIRILLCSSRASAAGGVSHLRSEAHCVYCPFICTYLGLASVSNDAVERANHCVA